MNALSLALAACLAMATYAEMQNVTVKGVAVCDKKVLHNVLVELYEKDTMNPDDLLAHIHTNANGEFQLYGEHDEAGYIRPYLRVRHNCHAKPNCARIAEYQIPQSALGDVYDMTFLTLDIKVAGETEVC